MKGGDAERGCSGLWSVNVVWFSSVSYRSEEYRSRQGLGGRMTVNVSKSISLTAYRTARLRLHLSPPLSLCLKAHVLLSLSLSSRLSFDTLYYARNQTRRGAVPAERELGVGTRCVVSDLIASSFVRDGHERQQAARPTSSKRV